ncbi:class I SAM-dependent methyltransferase [Pseudomonas sp. rhizo66]|uniref:class I SAM-dependent methyltransferase n=1 Tax=unclassified Pseudomonas TaxID=196821 RepID=UPI00202A793F|nr:MULTISPECIES: class I SAM-dependent methyltransferase [unclassified Pseudomonas]MCL9801745.1 class I SAM-dependent methyltransferase [Pseudomonas sp. AKS31]MDT3311852.1 class I SAM-dependent methyltransferase [Pseudomonas sp. rhizo66]
MKLKTALPSVLLLLPLTAFAAPASQSGEIRFSGQIVDSGCQVGPVGAFVARDSRQIEITPGVKVDVDTDRNACSHQALPISMRYEALKTSNDKGIVIISYL